LLRAASLSLGWTGQLSLARGGSNASLTASIGGIVYSTASAMAILAGTATANQMLLSGASGAPAWSTVTHPATTTINQILYSSAANVISGLATLNSGVLVTSAGGVPSISTTLPSGIAATNMNLTTPTLGVASATSINFGGGALGNYVPFTAFTPVIAFGGASVGVTYGTQIGFYMRIGSLIFFTIRLVLTSKGSSTGSATITGLPISSNATTCTYAYSFTGETITYATGHLSALMGSGSTTVSLYTQLTASNLTALADTNFANISGLYISGSYMA